MIYIHYTSLIFTKKHNRQNLQTMQPNLSDFLLFQHRKGFCGRFAYTTYCQDECTFENSVLEKPQGLVYRDVKNVILSDESVFIIFLSSGRVRVWRRTREQCRPECLTCTLNGSAAFCWHGLGPLVPLEGRVTANQYTNRLS